MLSWSHALQALMQANTARRDNFDLFRSKKIEVNRKRSKFSILFDLLRSFSIFFDRQTPFRSFSIFFDLLRSARQKMESGISSFSFFFAKMPNFRDLRSVPGCHLPQEPWVGWFEPWFVAVTRAQVQNSIGWILICSMNTFYLPKTDPISRIVHEGHCCHVYKSPTFIDWCHEIIVMQWVKMAVVLGSDITMKEFGAPCTDGAKSLWMIVRELYPSLVRSAPMSFTVKMHHFRRPLSARRWQKSVLRSP